MFHETEQNMSEDTQEKVQSQSAAFMRHQKKERWRTNNDKNKRHIWNHRLTNKEELQQKNRLGMGSRKKNWVVCMCVCWKEAGLSLNQTSFTRTKPHP